VVRRRLELVGHLPLYGVMAVLLVWTPAEAEQRLWVRGVLATRLGEHTMKTFGFEPDRVPTVARTSSPGDEECPTASCA
jgi:hypothetical protein